MNWDYRDQAFYDNLFYIYLSHINVKSVVCGKQAANNNQRKNEEIAYIQNQEIKRILREIKRSGF